MNPQLLFAVAMSACPIGMGLMMWMMNRNTGGQPGKTTPNSQTSAQRLTALRDQRKALEAEIAETARIAELEARREALRPTEASKPDNSRNSPAQSAD